MGYFFTDYQITSDYGVRVHPISGQEKMHNGIDFGVPANTDIKAHFNGTVVTSSYDAGGFGNYVVVQDKQGKMHYYAHLNKNSVKVGDTINIGDSIGLSGSTGASTGPHLHYEIRDASGKSINPQTGEYMTEQTNTNSYLQFDDNEDVSLKGFNSLNSSALSNAIGESVNKGFNSNGTYTPNINNVLGVSDELASQTLDTNQWYFNGGQNVWFENTKDKLKDAVFNIFKFVIIALIVVLTVVFITKGLDLNII